MMITAVLLHFIGAYVLAGAANHVNLWSWRRMTDVHWSERARLLYPARMASVFNLALIPLMLNRAHAVLLPGTMEGWVADGIAAVLGVICATFHLDHAVDQKTSLRKWCVSSIAGIGTGGFRLLPFIAAVALMPRTFGLGTLAVVAGYLAARHLIGRLLWLFLRWRKVLIPAGPRLQGIVDRTAATRSVMVRRTWVIDEDVCNAFALPLSKELLFGRRLLEISADEEVAAICAHEMGHLSESKGVLAGRILSSFVAFPFVFLKPSINYIGFYAIYVLLAMTYVIAIFTLRLERRMEERADDFAVMGYAAEGVYARALEKLYRESMTPAAFKAGTAHPSLYDRMVAARVVPDYPRPSPPKLMSPPIWLYLLLLLVLSVSSIAHV